MGTIADTFLAEGYAEGQSRVLLQWLEQRFGPLTDDVRSRVRNASSGDRKAWAAAVLDADSLDDVFARDAGS